MSRFDAISDERNRGAPCLEEMRRGRSAWPRGQIENAGGYPFKVQGGVAWVRKSYRGPPDSPSSSALVLSRLIGFILMPSGQERPSVLSIEFRTCKSQGNHY